MSQYDDLYVASQNFWAGHTGRERPPAPTFRMVNGRQKLGRYVDPYGCEMYMRQCKMRWNEWFMNFFFIIVGLVVGIEIDFLFLLVAAPIAAGVYYLNHAKLARIYLRWEAIQQTIIQTGEPVWVPYDRKRLKNLYRLPPL